MLRKDLLDTLRTVAAGATKRPFNGIFIRIHIHRVLDILHHRLIIASVQSVIQELFSSWCLRLCFPCFLLRWAFANPAERVTRRSTSPRRRTMENEVVVVVVVVIIVRAAIVGEFVRVVNGGWRRCW